LEKGFSCPMGRLAPIILILAVFLFNCSTLPPIQPVKDIGSFVGTWHGKIWNGDRGWDFPISLTAEEDGIFSLTMPPVIDPDLTDPGLTQFIGKWGVKDGKLWFKSEKFWMNGTGILHEGGGKRFVIFNSDGDDGRTSGWVQPSSYGSKFPALK
jgi:hypothetical protein